MLSSFPDLYISIADIVAEGDKVMVRVLLEGTHQGGALGVPLTVDESALLASSSLASRTGTSSKPGTVGTSLGCCGKSVLYLRRQAVIGS